VLIGLLLEEDDFFIKFRTSKNIHLINKTEIEIISDTEQEFKEENGDPSGSQTGGV